MGASLAAGHFEPADCTVTCPWHAWRFDTRDGTWCDNRRLKVDAYQVRVVGGEVQVAPADASESFNPAAGSSSAASENPLSHPADENDEKK